MVPRHFLFLGFDTVLQQVGNLIRAPALREFRATSRFRVLSGGDVSMVLMATWALLSGFEGKWDPLPSGGSCG